MKKLIIKPKNIYSVIALLACSGLVMGSAVLGPKEITKQAALQTSDENNAGEVPGADYDTGSQASADASTADESLEKEVSDADFSIDDFGGQLTSDDANVTGEEWIYVEDDTYSESGDTSASSEWTEYLYDDTDMSIMGDSSWAESSSVTAFSGEKSGAFIGTSGVTGVSSHTGNEDGNTNPSATGESVLDENAVVIVTESSSYDASEGQDYETPILPAR